MTIAIIGGEGSVGKTTILNLLAQYSALDHKPTLYIDANPDQNGLEFGGVDQDIKETVKPLANGMHELAYMLEGHNPHYNDNLAHVIATSPATVESKGWTVQTNDPVMRAFAIEHEGLFFMQTGSYTSQDAGVTCSHDKIGPLVFMLQRANDDAQGHSANIFVDYAHGEDGFGTPLYPQADLIMVVVRGNKKSRDIMGKYLQLATQIGSEIGHEINIAVIGNQLSNDPEKRQKQEEFIKEIAGERYVGGLIMDEALEREFENTAPRYHELSAHNQRAIALLANAVDAAPKIPALKQAWLRRVHGELAPWYDKKHGTDGKIAAQGESHVCGEGCNHTNLLRYKPK